ncbi:MAG: SAM-dependent chlorinase/fluorinase [Cytophagales bacterium]
MAIITFTSDFGIKDHYVAAVKAVIYSFNPNIKIEDISHEIQAHDIGHGAHILGSVFRDFPKGTVHLVAINAQNAVKEKLIALKIEEHFFVGEDNGFFSLLTEKKPTAISELPFDPNSNDTFPEKNVLARAAVSLANGSSVYDLGKQLLETKIFRHRSPLFGPNEIECHVKHIDTYGNLITNLNKESFEEKVGYKFDRISIKREDLDHISKNYKDTTPGDAVAFFNSNGWLQININFGNASELFGMQVGDSLFVHLKQ